MSSSPEDDVRQTEHGDDIRRAHVIVSGRVQGVWFRDSARHEAERHGVAGWVRNLPDGRVEAVYEGPAAAVDRLIDWTRHGPERASVRDVDVKDETPHREKGFQIRG